MTKVKPFIPCVDYWPVKIPPEKMKAYNEMIEEGQIRKHHVTYNRVTGSTIVEYFAIAPHEWILEELKKRSERYDKRKADIFEPGAQPGCGGPDSGGHGQADGDPERCAGGLPG